MRWGPQLCQLVQSAGIDNRWLITNLRFTKMPLRVIKSLLGSHLQECVLWVIIKSLLGSHLQECVLWVIKSLLGNHLQECAFGYQVILVYSFTRICTLPRHKSFSGLIYNGACSWLRSINCKAVISKGWELYSRICHRRVAVLNEGILWVSDFN